MATIEVVAHSNQNQGVRERMEDRAVQFRSRTRGGLELQVAIVCDGAGGGDDGEFASQTAITAIEKSIIGSPQSDIIAVLIEAVQQANTLVYRQLNGNGYSTAAVIAVVLNEDPPSVYIASVGDSPIYLYYRDEKKKQQLLRLNIEHNVKDDPLYDGERSRNGRTDLLTRSIGGGPTVHVDVGRYTYQGKPITDPQEADELGREGFNLGEGYTLFAASDGLRGDCERGGEALTEREILHHMDDKDVARAATLLIDYARVRRPLDNISIALIFADAPYRKDASDLSKGFRGLSTFQRAAAGGIVLGLLFIFFFMSLAVRNGMNVNATQAAVNATQNLEGTSLALTLSATPTDLPTLIPTDLPTPLPSSTPTMMPTPTTAPIQNEVARVFGSGSAASASTINNQPLLENQPIASNSRAAVHGGDVAVQEGDRAQIMTGNNSNVVLDFADSARREILLNVSRIDTVPGQQSKPLFVVNGFYSVEVDAEVQTGSIKIEVPSSTDACVSVHYVAQDVRLECLSNECSYLNGSKLTRNQYVLISLQTNQSTSPGPLSAADVYPLWQEAKETQLTPPMCLRSLLDSDNDQFANFADEDGCPEQAGKVQGCPDADKDTVPENIDECDTIPGPVSNRGCPLDSDGDGVPNYSDQCPTEKGPRDNYGCPIRSTPMPTPVAPPPTATREPDRDNDGVADSRDQCPDNAGPGSNRGCPTGS